MKELSLSSYGMDYISHLPDDALSRILSRLPIKDTVKTCVLSKDWEFKWTLVYNININKSDLSLEWQVEPGFTNLVERVLVHVRKVENLILKCSSLGKNELSRITPLISAKLRMGVKCLDLQIYYSEDIFLPCNLLNGNSLRKLDLTFTRFCSVRVPEKNSLPHLKILHLLGVHFINDISGSDTLIFTFPVLEELKLSQCKWVKVKVVEFHAPSLCRLTSYTPDELDSVEVVDYTIKLIGGATISDFCVDGGYIENIIMNGSAITSANLGCYDPNHRDCGLQVRKLLRGVPNLRHLGLFTVLWAIDRTKQELPLPRFSKLEQIHILPFYGAEGLVELLHAAPFLKSLVLDHADDAEYYDYDSLELLPSCVLHHLEEVTLYYVDSPTPNYCVEKFFLTRGKQLKNVFIRVQDDEDEVIEAEIFEKLSMFPKASSDVKIMQAP